MAEIKDYFIELLENARARIERGETIGIMILETQIDKPTHYCYAGGFDFDALDVSFKRARSDLEITHTTPYDEHDDSQ